MILRGFFLVGWRNGLLDSSQIPDISARETASNKTSAARCCALSLVRQLFHLNVIPANKGAAALKKKDLNRKVKPVEVRMEEDLKERVTECLRAFDITPVDWVRTFK
jgi:ATP-dependent RNA helicase A